MFRSAMSAQQHDCRSCTSVRDIAVELVNVSIVSIVLHWCSSLLCLRAVSDSCNSPIRTFAGLSVGGSLSLGFSLLHFGAFDRSHEGIFALFWRECVALQGSARHAARVGGVNGRLRFDRVFTVSLTVNSLASEAFRARNSLPSIDINFSRSETWSGIQLNH